MPERALLLTYSFPPMTVPEAILSAKRAGNLPLECHVVTMRPFKSWMGSDDSLDGYVREKFASVTRVEPPKWMRTVPLGRLGPLIKAPDQFRFLNKRLVEAATEMIGSFDHLITWSQWHSVHLAGRSLKRSHPDLTWSAHLSDPWSNNPYVRQNSALERLNTSLEAGVFADADALFFPAQQTADYTLDRHPKSRGKAHVIPHAYDPSLYPKPPCGRTGPLLMRYMGAFYGPRSPSPLIEGLQLLMSEQPGETSDVIVESIGPINRRMLDDQRADGPARDIVSFLPPVGYTESLGAMVEADILLVVDAPGSSSPFLPSKLIDYVGARRLIVGITPPGPAADLIERLGGWHAAPEQPGAIAEALAAAMAHTRAHRDEPFGPDDVVSEYRADVIAQQMAEVMRKVRGSR